MPYYNNIYPGEIVGGRPGYHNYRTNQYGTSNSESEGRFQAIHHTPPTATLDLKGATGGTVLASWAIQHDRAELLDLVITYVAATSNAATMTHPGAISIRILKPGAASPGITLNALSKLTISQGGYGRPASGDGSRDWTDPATGLIEDRVALRTDQVIRAAHVVSLGCENQKTKLVADWPSVMFPQVVAGDVVEILHQVVGVGGTQNIHCVLRFRERLATDELNALPSTAIVSPLTFPLV